MNEFKMGSSFEENGQQGNELKELSPEAQKIAAGLESLAEEKNQMAIRVLCAGQGKEHGSFHTEGIGFRLLGNSGEKLETMRLQVEASNKSYNFGLWEDNLEGLARDLASAGLTAEQLDNYVKVVRDVSSRIEKHRNQWVITQYGPNNDGIKSFEDFLKE